MTQLTTYTDHQAFGFVKLYNPNTYKNELAPCVARIVRISNGKRISAENAMKLALKTSMNEAERIYLLAAFYAIRTKQTLTDRTIKQVEQEIADCKTHISMVQFFPISENFKNFLTHTSASRMFHLRKELAAIRQLNDFISDIKITAQVIMANGSEFLLH